MLAIKAGVVFWGLAVAVVSVAAFVMWRSGLEAPERTREEDEAMYLRGPLDPPPPPREHEIDPPIFEGNGGQPW